MSATALPGPEGQFADSRVKVIRAKQHIYDLTRLIETHEREYEPEVRFDPNERAPDGKRQAHIQVLVTALPPRASAIVGDALHNLRAALDLLAVGLVELNGQKATNRVAFPFGEDAEDLEEKRKRHHLNLMADDDWEEVKQLRPFLGGDKLLCALHDLDILDKHRRLLPNGTNVNTPNVGPKIDPITGKPVGWEDGDIRMEITPGTKPKIEFTFPEGEPLAKRPLLDGLRSLAGLVDSILKKFEERHPK